MLTSVPPQGTLLLVEEKYDVSDEEIDPRGLLVHVGGDTLTAIHYAAQEKELERPMTLQLLLNILEYYRELQPLEWHLLHVAIVDIRDDVFIGRLFFGNPETGEIRWDCDCRPSDACWLSMKRMCPLYIHNAVWETCAQSLQKMITTQFDIRSTLEKLGFVGDPSSALATETNDPMTTIMPNDPTAIKRLKREMSVAVMEEDYSTAARIRDHPYMRKYKSIFDLRKEGKQEQASHLEEELRHQIEKDDTMQGDV